MRQTQNQRLAAPIELRSKQLRKTATRPLVDRSDVVVPIGPHILNQRKNNWPQLSLQDGLFILRLSLATVFFWFGVLKIANVSPAVAILKSSFPVLANPPFLELLGVVEVAIAIGLVVKCLSRQTIVMMVLHLMGTLSVAVLSPHLIFAPVFPMLTLEGEFLVKNLVLIAAGVCIIVSRE